LRFLGLFKDVQCWLRLYRLCSVIVISVDIVVVNEHWRLMLLRHETFLAQHCLILRGSKHEVLSFREERMTSILGLINERVLLLSLPARHHRLTFFVKLKNFVTGDGGFRCNLEVIEIHLL